MRRVASTTAVALALVLALASCGNDDVAGPSSSTTSATDGDVTVTSPSAPSGGSGAPDREAERVEPQPGRESPAPVPFESAEADPTDDQQLIVRYWAGIPPCNVLDRVEVDETDTAVTVTIYVGTDPDAGDDVVCIEIAKLFETVLELDAPLGGREIVDGAL